MTRLLLTYFLCSAFVSVSFSQSFNKENKLEKTSKNFIKGFSSALEWYDLPVGLAYLYKGNYRKSALGNSINIYPSNYEQSLTARAKVSTPNSFGSIYPNYLANYVFLGRLTIASYQGLFTDAEISDKTFQRIFAFRKAVLYTSLLTDYVKSTVRRKRPDGSDERSFFSGHTSITFATSTYLYLEMSNMFDSWEVTRHNKTKRFFYKAATFSVLYGWASYVAYSRLRDNKHYLSDVLVGAAVGSLLSSCIFHIYNKEDQGLFQHFDVIPTSRESIQFSVNLKF